MASPGLTRGIIQHFMASFEDFLCACCQDEAVGEISCAVPAAFLRLNRSVYLPRFTLHLLLHSRVTLRVCRQEEIRRIKRMHHLTSSLPAYACHVTWTWSHDTHSTMGESCFQQKFA